GYVAVGVALAVAVATGVPGGGQVPAAPSLTKSLPALAVPAKVMQYLFVPPSRLTTTSTAVGPLKLAYGPSFPTTLSNPGLILATLTCDIPSGASGFLNLKSVEAPLHRGFGSTKGTGSMTPSSKVIEESEPPTGSEPVRSMLGSREISMNFEGVSSSFFPVIPWSDAVAEPAVTSSTSPTRVLSVTARPINVPRALRVIMPSCPCPQCRC